LVQRPVDDLVLVVEQVQNLALDLEMLVLVLVRQIVSLAVLLVALEVSLLRGSTDGLNVVGVVVVERTRHYAGLLVDVRFDASIFSCEEEGFQSDIKVILDQV